MSLWVLGVIVAGSGAVGGLVNALISDNGFPLPSFVGAESAGVLRPGFIGNMIIGAAAAFVTWGLYGRWAGAAIAGASPNTNPAKFFETLSGVTGAFVAGIGGARILTAQVDKQVLRLTATTAITSPPDPSKAGQVAVASPADALKAVLATPTSSP